MIQPSPNSELIQSLIATYYNGEGLCQDDGDDKYVSSYWRYHTKLFKIETNDNNSIKSLKAIAIGDQKWPSWGMKYLDLACIFFHILILPDRINAIRNYLRVCDICKKMEIDPTINAYRQVCTLNVIAKNIPEETAKGRMFFLMIGDGYGILSALIKNKFPNSTIVFIDIGRTLLFQAYYCGKVFPNLKHEQINYTTSDNIHDFIYCPTEHLNKLDQFSFDIVTNIASMQEMNPSTIARYFHFIRKHVTQKHLFYCCNREFKEMVGGDTSEFLRYPWAKEDMYLIDGDCPWFNFFFAKGKFERELQIAGISVPLIKYYNGRMLHRLARLSRE